MIRAATLFIKYAPYLLLLFIIAACITPFLLVYWAGLPLNRASLIAFEVATAKPPTDFETVLIGNGSSLANYWWYMNWLCLLKLLAWLVIPILAGIIINKGQEELAREITEHEEQLQRFRKLLEVRLREKFVASGLPDFNTSDLLDEWDSIIANHNIENRRT